MTRRNRLLGCLAALLLLAAGVYLGLGAFIGIDPSNLFHNPGDAGGRILAQLRPVATAVPTGARVKYMLFTDSKSDSCDGMAGTQGWDGPRVDGAFVWNNRSAHALYASFNRSMEGLGWRPAGTRSHVLGSKGKGRKVGSSRQVAYFWTWNKRLASKRNAVTQLSNESPYGYWEVDATAPASLPGPTGC